MLLIVFGENMSNAEETETLADAMIIVHKRFPSALHKGVWRAAVRRGWKDAYLEFFDAGTEALVGMIVNARDESPEPGAFLCGEDKLPIEQLPSGRTGFQHANRRPQRNGDTPK